MAKRVTIKNDPLGDLNPAERPDNPPATNPDAEPTTRGTADQSKEALTKRKAAARPSVREATGRRKERVHRAAGGQLELLGGSFGTGLASIRRFGDGRIGFISPTDERVNLESEVEAVTSSRDREEHRLLSAAGWAWAAGAIMGPLGVALGGGLRLLHPKRMMLNVRLRDGRMLVARTDSVTCAALQALSGIWSDLERR